MSKLNKTKLTPEQLKALDISTMKNIIVSAQAGAGKTFVLTKRIIELIEKERKLNKGIDIDNFLIVTFTNKAAYEMKDRIRKDLYKKPKDILEESIENNSRISDDELKEIQKFYQRQYNKTINAQISTMHSFGINILRKYFYKIGLNPNFKLLTDSSLEIIEWEAMTEVFDDLYANEDYDFQKLVSRYSDKYDDTAIMKILFKIYNFIQSQLKPFEWLKEKIEKIPNKDYFEDENNRKEYIDKLKENAKKNILEDIDKAYEIINSIKAKPNSKLKEKYIEKVDSDIDLIENFRTIDSYDKIKNTKKLVFSRAPSITAKFLQDNGIEESDKIDIKSKLDSYRNLFKDMKYLEYSQEEEIESVILTRETLDTIYKILVLYDKKFRLKKESQNSLDFNDIEHLFLKLLEDEQIVEEIQSKYKYIFFDEYQDANNIQNEIVNIISRGDNLYFVGDIKQSIYNFRLADPKIFKQRYNDFKSKEGPFEAIDLHHNFRSHEQLLRFNNMLFEEIMTEELGDVNYRTDNHGLQKGLEKYETNKANIELDFIIKDKSSKELSEQQNLDSEVLDTKAEAIFIAKRIDSLIKNGKRLADIAVLARSRVLLDQVKESLINFGIEYFYESSQFSYEDIEIKSFIEILKAIDNDNDDITLLSALTSTIGEFTDEELAKIRGNNKNDSFNYCFYNYENEEVFDIEILNKIKSYKSTIKKYREISKIYSLHDFAWYVFVDSGYMSYVLSKKDGDKKVEEINLLISEIAELESQRFFTLTSLLKYMDRILKRKLADRESTAKLSERDDVVRLMTIHKSKGLQFDTVFVCGLDKKFNKKDLHNDVIMNDEEGIALVTLNSNDYEDVRNNIYKNIRDKKEYELLSEEARILYVALTRAVNSLHLVSSVENFNVNENSYKKMASYKDWIIKVFEEKLMTNGEFDELKIETFRNTEKLNINVNIINEVDLYIYLNNKTNNVNNINYDRVISDEEISKILNFEYDRTLVSIPYKKTVTELSQTEDNTSSDFKSPETLTNEDIENELQVKKPKFIDELQINPMEKGSLYHYLFELMPIQKMDCEEVNDFLLNLVNNKFISQKEYESIDIKYFNNFINSDLFNRLLNADKVEKEKSFTMKYQEKDHTILVDGQIDLYFIENNKISILDFKSNKNINEKAYERQLNLYKEGIERAFNMEVKDLIIYWIMHNKVSYIEKKG